MYNLLNTMLHRKSWENSSSAIIFSGSIAVFSLNCYKDFCMDPDRLAFNSQDRSETAVIAPRPKLGVGRAGPADRA